MSRFAAVAYWLAFAVIVCAVVGGSFLLGTMTGAGQ